MHRVMDGNKDTQNAQRPADWRSLAKQASVEMDPEKLMNLALELNGGVEEQQKNFFDLEAYVKRTKEWHLKYGLRTTCTASERSRPRFAFAACSVTGRPWR